MDKILSYLISDGKLTWISKAVVVVVLYILTKIAIVVFRKFIDKVFEKKVAGLKNKKKFSTIISIFTSIFTVIVYFVFLIAALTVCGIDTSGILATAGLSSVAIAFGVQHILQDLFSGFLFILDDVYNIGDDIIINGIEGEVTSVNLRNISVKGYDGSENIIANSSINVVTNLSKSSQRSLIKFRFPIGVDMEKVREVITAYAVEYKAMNNDVVANPSIFGVTDMGSYYTELAIAVWSKPSTQWDNERDFREKMLLEFRDKNIEFLTVESKGDIDV